MKPTKLKIDTDPDAPVKRSEGTIASKYLKMKELGNGSFVSYLSLKDKQTREYRFCKEITKRKIFELPRFNAEIEYLMTNEHPNIPKIYDIYEDERKIDLIMEECKGGNLLERIIKKLNNGKTFCEREAGEIFQQIINALLHCHKVGISHKDLRPENILFTNEDENDTNIKVIDFGLSKIFGEIQAAKKEKIDKKHFPSKLGDIHYASPEVLIGNLDEKSDIWAAGVILYIMLTGNAPFNGNNDAEIIKAINKKKATYPENDFKNISDEAKDLLKHMICDADKRFNVNQIIEHNWLVKVVPNSEKELDDFNQDNFKEFVKIPKLKRDILMFIVDNLGDFDIQLLKDVFVQMDANKDGTLTLQEFKDGIIKLFPTENPPEITEENENQNQNENENEKEKENNENQEVKIKLDDETLKKNKEIVDKAEELFNTFDLTSEGRFDYNDFIINSLDRHLILMEEKLFMAFWMMDRDGSGKLDKTEIKQALGLDLDNATLNKLIGQYDLNGDGEIDYLEFLNMMLNPPPKEEEVETGKKKK